MEHTLSNIFFGKTKMWWFKFCLPPHGTQFLINKSTNVDALLRSLFMLGIPLSKSSESPVSDNHIDKEILSLRKERASPKSNVTFVMSISIIKSDKPPSEGHVKDTLSVDFSHWLTQPIGFLSSLPTCKHLVTYWVKDVMLLKESLNGFKGCCV